MSEHLSRKKRSEVTRERICTEIPIQIRTMRMSRGWSQEELAKRSGLKQTQIAKLETVPLKEEPNARTLLRIAHALDVALAIRMVPWRAFDVRSFDQEDREDLEK